MRSLLENKKGEFESVLLAVISIFAVGVILFFFSHMNNQIYDKFDEYFEDSEFNGTEAHLALEGIQDVEQTNIWDWGFLAIYIGIIIQIVVFAFATRINIAFYWIMVIVDIPILIVGVVLSNIWQELAANPEFATTLTRFPITNTLLGTYYPIAVVALMFIAAVVLFGKPPTTEIM